MFNIPVEDKHPRYDKFISLHRACYYRLQTGSCFSKMSNALGFKLFPRGGIPLERFIYLKRSHHDTRLVHIHNCSLIC